MKAATAPLIDIYSSIERLQNKCSLFLAELHALYLDLDQVQTSDDDDKKFIRFSASKPTHQAIWGREWKHPLVLGC